MQSEPSRRSFIATAAATALAATVPSTVASSASDSAELAYRSAGELVKELAQRRISARELLSATVDRIETLDPKINAVVVRDFDRARQQADAADAALAKGERRPLLGLRLQSRNRSTSRTYRRHGLFRRSRAGNRCRTRSPWHA
jgi:amidase